MRDLTPRIVFADSGYRATVLGTTISIERQNGSSYTTIAEYADTDASYMAAEWLSAELGEDISPEIFRAPR